MCFSSRARFSLRTPYYPVTYACTPYYPVTHAAQRAEDELHGVEVGQVAAVATERPLEEVDAPAVDAVERALEVAVLVEAHGRQPAQAMVAMRDLVALEHLAIRGSRALTGQVLGAGGQWSSLGLGLGLGYGF